MSYHKTSHQYEAGIHRSGGGLLSFAEWNQKQRVNCKTHSKAKRLIRFAHKQQEIEVLNSGGKKYNHSDYVQMEADNTRSQEQDIDAAISQLKASIDEHVVFRKVPSSQLLFPISKHNKKSEIICITREALSVLGSGWETAQSNTINTIHDMLVKRRHLQSYNEGLRQRSADLDVQLQQIASEMQEREGLTEFAVLDQSPPYATTSSYTLPLTNNPLFPRHDQEEERYDREEAEVVQALAQTHIQPAEIIKPPPYTISVPEMGFISPIRVRSRERVFPVEESMPSLPKPRSLSVKDASAIHEQQHIVALRKAKAKLREELKADE